MPARAEWFDGIGGYRVGNLFCAEWLFDPVGLRVHDLYAIDFLGRIHTVCTLFSALSHHFVSLPDPHDLGGCEVCYVLLARIASMVPVLPKGWFDPRRVLG